MALERSLVLFVIYLSLTPHPITIPVARGDKVGHVAAQKTALSAINARQASEKVENRQALCLSMFCDSCRVLSCAERRLRSVPSRPSCWMFYLDSPTV
jgi:hypothetical protein